MASPPPDFLSFDLSFDPALSNIFPTPPPLPSSGSLFTSPSDGNLFSPSEQSGILGFLEGFDPWDVEIPQDIPFYDPPPPQKQSPAPPYSNPHLNSAPDPSTSSRPKNNSLRVVPYDSMLTMQDAIPPEATSRTESMSQSNVPRKRRSSESPSAARGKQSLSTPQKRLNHIMSEQKRRNAIRDGYAQLITLIAPAGAPCIDMPSRGRPKGSSSRGGKNSSKGKSGVLFRAVEYIKWLEEGRDALREEVMRVEYAAGLRHA